MHCYGSSALVAGVFLCALGMTSAQVSSSAPPPSPNAPGSTSSEKTVPGSAAQDYSKEAGVIERLDRVYLYAADGTGSKLITASIRVTNDAAVKQWSVLSFPYPSGAEHLDVLYVRIHHADNTTFETPGTDAQDMPAPITREAPFYSDLKEKQIPVRGLHAGDRLEYSVREVRTKPEAPGYFWGTETFFGKADGVVMLEESVELHVPKASHATVWSPANKPTLSENGADQVYRWTSSQPVALASLDERQIRQLKADRENETSDGGRLPAIAWTNFQSWKDVGAWYRGMEGSRIEPDADIRAKVAELTAGKTTPEQKAQAIYNFVGPQVRYIGVAFGIGRYQPHEAGDVLRNQYGDCKDKHTLLAAMLTAAGFQVNAALIGAGIHFNQDVPSPGSFNHLITQVKVGDRDVWLDSTSELAPYELLLPMLRGKLALVVPPSGAAAIEMTPKEPPYAPEVRFEAVGTLDEKGTSHSHMVLTDRADEEVILRNAARSVSPAQWDELMQRFSQGMGFAGKVTHADFSRPEDMSTPFRMTYEYEREKSGDWDNRRILPQFIPVSLPMVDEDEPPLSPIDLGEKRKQTDHAELTLPTGWGADLPPAIHAVSPFATMDKTYRFESGKIISDRKLEVLKDKVPAADWRAYEKWAKAASLESESYIPLTRTGGARAAGNTNPEAQQLIVAATQLEQQGKWDDALAKLDEAKKRNADQAYLWSNYGFIALQYGKLNEAKADLLKEIAAHPDEERPYGLLANVQMRQGRKDEAAATLRQLLAHNPDSLEANAELAAMLYSQKDYSGAEAALQHVLTAHPENLPASISLGRVLLRENKKDKAEPVLRKVLDQSQDPGMLNDAAYELADEALDLSFAEEAAKKSLDLQQEQQDAAGNGGSEIAMLQRASLLVATWDTYGWILYREGKFAEAEPWVRAAWRNGPNDELGLHMGMVLEKLGRHKEAEQALDLAQGADHGLNSESVAKQIAAERENLRKSGVAVQVSDPRSALQGARTFQVPRGSNSATGAATVEFEVSGKGATDPRFVQGGEQFIVLLDEIGKINFDPGISSGNRAKLTRRGMLSCHSGKACMFVLMSPGAALADLR